MRLCQPWEKLFVGEKLKFLLKEFLFIKNVAVYKNLVEHGRRHRSVTIASTELSNVLLSPWQNVVTMTSL